MSPHYSLFRAILLAAPVFLILALAPATTKATAGLDPLFQNTGWTTRPAAVGSSVEAMALQSDGRVILAGYESRDGRWEIAVWRARPDGTPDSDFRWNFADYPGLGLHTYATRTAVQSDGKILVAGTNGPGGVPSSPWSTLLLRCHPDGRPDTTFGGAGTGYAHLPGQGHAMGLAVLNDGKILLATGEVVARFLPDGTLDSSFAAAAAVSGQPGMARGRGSMAVQSDGKILLFDSNTNGAIATRLLPDGVPDPAFGTGGSTTGNLFPRSIVPSFIIDQRIAALPDGKTLVGGGVASGGILAVLRLLSDGSKDPSFGEGGFALANFPGVGTRVASLLPQEDGGVIVAGNGAGAHNWSDIILARFHADGTPDTVFGPGGKLRITFGDSNDYCRAAILLPDNKILAAGPYWGADLQAPPGVFLARFRTHPLAVGLASEPAGSIMSPSLGSLNFGIVPLGSRTDYLVLRNSGAGTLTNITVSLTNESHPGEYAFTRPDAAALAPGEETPFLITFTPSEVPGRRTATLRILASGPGGDPEPLTLYLTGSRATPYEVWRYTWFADAENRGYGSDGYDFDGDGLVNFMEYATGGHPHQPGPQPVQVIKNGANVEVTCRLAVAALTEFNFQPESAAGLDGPWSTMGLNPVVVSDDGTVQIINVTVPIEGSRRFFRLRVAHR